MNPMILRVATAVLALVAVGKLIMQFELYGVGAISGLSYLGGPVLMFVAAFMFWRAANRMQAENSDASRDGETF